MSYEIPQALKYEERVIGPLTLRQFVALGVPGLLSLAVMKTGLPFQLRAGLTAGLMAVGALFAFFELDRKLFTVLSYYRAPRKVGYLDSRMGSLVMVKDIRDGMILLKDGRKRGVLQVRPMNFMIKSKDDKEAIIENFQKFLNSLDFPIQILMRTVNLDLDGYLKGLKETVGKRVEEKENLKLQKLFDSYYDFLKRYVEDNAVKNRLFYLIVPAPVLKGSRYEEELSQLKIRTQLCREGLSTMGITSERLNTEKLTSLLSSFFEGYIEVDNDYLYPVTLLEKFKESEYNEKD